MSTRSATMEPSARPDTLQEQFDDPAQQRQAANMGMWVFLTTEIMFFGVLFAAFTVLRVQYPAGFAEAARKTDMLLGSIETAVLLISSVVVMLAVRAVKLDQRRVATWLMAGTAALGIVFLAIHGYEYYSEYQEHLIPGINFDQTGPHAHAVELFYCLYYFITGFHTLHLLIAIILVMVLTLRVARDTYGPGRYTTLELTAMYWHLVDIVWIFVYPVIYLLGRSG